MWWRVVRRRPHPLEDLMPLWIPLVACVLAVAVVAAIAAAWVRHREHAADRRYVALMRSNGDLMGKLKAIQEEQDDVRRAIRNHGEGMVVLSEQVSMELGEIRKLVAPKPAARTRKAPAAK